MYSRFLLASLKLLVTVILEALFRRREFRTSAVKSAADKEHYASSESSNSLVTAHDDASSVTDSKNEAK